METPARNRVAFLIGLAIVCGSAAYAFRPASRFQMHGSPPRLYLLDSWTGEQWLVIGQDARRVARYGPPSSNEDLDQEAEASYQEALRKAREPVKSKYDLDPILGAGASKSK